MEYVSNLISRITRSAMNRRGQENRVEEEPRQDLAVAPVPVQEGDDDSVDSGASSSSSLDPQEEDPILRIPNEVWVLILSDLGQKELVQARTVWKKWREVVDAHFEFTVIVHDGKTDLDRVYNLRIKDCLITRLLEDKEIFQFPSLLRRLRFWGPINVECFQRMMNQATEVEELSLTKFALMQDNLLNETRLRGFSKIKKLELLGYQCKDESHIIAKNTRFIFSYDMPDLEKLTINFHCEITAINRIALAFMEFVSRQRRLKNLIASLVPEASHPVEIARPAPTVTIPDQIQQSLQSVQLSVLRITTSTKDLPIWTALLNAQKRLVDLRIHISEGGLPAIQPNYVTGVHYDMLREPLTLNATTLVAVELKEIRLNPLNGPAGAGDNIAVDASIFRYATNLKKLILFRNSDDYRRFPQYPDQPAIINFKMLPTSIEILEISRFSCNSEELQFVVDVLENLKTIVLTHTGNLGRLGVHGGIVESITKKTNILSMNLSPVNFSCPIENKKYDVVKAKFGMHDGDHIFFDFEKFRNGLPQPRPPVSETCYIIPSTRSMIIERTRNPFRCLPGRLRGRSQSNSGGPCPRHGLYPAYVPMPTRRYRKEDPMHRFETMLMRYHRILKTPCSRCRVVESNFFLDSARSSAECIHKHHISQLLQGLDLQITPKQKLFQFDTPCGSDRPTIYYRHSNPPPLRKRRWSEEALDRKQCML